MIFEERSVNHARCLEGHNKKLLEQVRKRLEIWNKAMKGDTKAIKEAAIMRGMVKREDFAELDFPEEKRHY